MSLLSVRRFNMYCVLGVCERKPGKPFFVAPGRVECVGALFCEDESLHIPTAVAFQVIDKDAVQEWEAKGQTPKNLKGHAPCAARKCPSCLSRLGGLTTMRKGLPTSAVVSDDAGNTITLRYETAKPSFVDVV